MNVRPDLFAGILPFVRTADERSFGRAAASLGVTTAAVSKAVRRLEDDLGVRLLERSSRVVSLTREGELFLERCRPAVLGVHDAREAVIELRREPQGEVVVTMPHIVAPFVVRDLGRFAAQFPRLIVNLRLSDRIARLADEGYDVAIRMGDLPASSLVTRVLRRTRWVTVAASSYLRRAAPLDRPEDLAAHACLRFVGPTGQPRDWHFVEEGRPVQLAVRGSLTIDNGTQLVAAAAAGLGVTQVPDFTAQDALRDGALVEVLAAHAADGPTVQALTTASRARSGRVRAVMRFLVEAFR